MARTPSLNRTIRIMPENKATQFWAPLVTEAGCAFDATRRGVVPDVVARLMEAHLASSPKATFGAVAHGLRAINDGTTGAGCPFFIEAKGAAIGEVLCLAAGNHDAMRGLLGANITGSRAVAKAAGNLYLTLAQDADVDAVYRVLSTHVSVRGNVGYDSAKGAPTDLDAVAFEAAPAPATEASATATEKAPKGKRGRKAKADKVEADAPPADSTEAA